MSFAEWTDPDRAERLDFDWAAEADHARKLRAIREREFLRAISAEVPTDRRRVSSGDAPPQTEGAPDAQD